MFCISVLVIFAPAGSGCLFAVGLTVRALRAACLVLRCVFVPVLGRSASSAGIVVWSPFRVRLRGSLNLSNPKQLLPNHAIA
jgi:hypothetical protein